MSQATDLIQRVSKSAAGAITESTEFIRKHPVTSAVTVGGGVLAATQVVRIVKKSKKKKAAKKAKKKTTKRAPGKRSKLSWQLDRARISKQKHEVAYQRRKKRLSSKKTKKRPGVIYYTKKGQPYKVNARGQAKFIKKTKRRKR